MKLHFEKLQEIKNFGKDFLLSWEKDLDQLTTLILVAAYFKEALKRQKSIRIFDSGLALSIFRDKSTRTRYSYASAANALGLSVMDLDEAHSQISHGETVQETANMLAFTTDAVGIRDDVFLGAGNAYMQEFSRALDYGFQHDALHQRPALINLQCDIDHPTQTLADLSKLKDYFGSLDNLKGRKMAVSWAYSPTYGKPMSVPQGLIGLMTRFGMDITLAHPEGYELMPDVLEVARQNAAESGSSFEVTNDMDAAFENAEVVYPKSWAPIEIMKQRTELLKAGNTAELGALELECLNKNRKNIHWVCNADRMKRTCSGEALYMHCLPADISGVNCENGEVTRDVFDKYRPQLYQEASYKPFVIAAMIFLARVDNPYQKLNEILNRDEDRF